MSTPPNFESSYDWSKNYLNSLTPKDPPQSSLSIFLVIFLLVVALAWWWVFYGSSWNNHQVKAAIVPLAGLDDLKKGAIQGKSVMTVKPNGVATMV